MDARTAIDLMGSESLNEEEPCLGLREGEILRASVLELRDDGAVRLGLLGAQTWVRSEASLFVGQELDLMVQGRGESVQLRILGQDGPSSRACRDGQARSGVDLEDENRRRKASGSFAMLPLPASQNGVWGPSRLYFASDDSGEQLVLHLSPGEEGELRVDLHLGAEGVELRADVSQLRDVERLRALMPEFEEALQGMGLELRMGAIRCGPDRKPPVLDLTAPPADGRPLLDEEA